MIITDVHALADAIRDGELSQQKREHMIDLLHTLNTPVATAYTELAAKITPTPGKPHTT
jgi:hypothetical protein